MERMTGVQNPSAMSDYDWLELVSFAWKVDREGYQYAAEEYRPEFEDPKLPTAGPALRALLRENRLKVARWWETVGGRQACDLVNEHLDESRRRKDNACLWGIRCTDGYVIYCCTEAEQTRTSSELKTWFDKGNRGARVPAALLYRDVPGGPWAEIELAV